MLDRPPPVPVSHSLEGGTVGQVSLKALAARVLRCPKAVYQPGQLQDPCTETVPLSRTSGRGTAGQALEWDADDWRGFFEERAAIAEHDGGVLRAEAEARAFDCCVAQWMAYNPPAANGPDRCAHCGGAMADNEALPFLNGAGGHVWMHGRCHAGWMARRKADAVRALSDFGLRPPALVEIR